MDCLLDRKEEKEMEMKLPNSYTELQQEEMMYLDGGQFMSKTSCKNLLAALGLNPGNYIAVALTVTIATKIVKYAKTCGGIWGWVAGIVVGWAGGQMIKFGQGVIRGAYYKGVNITWKWDWLASGIDYKVSY